MSTRSVVRVFEGTEEVCTIYRHHDGYPSGMGADLVTILEGRRVVNGLSVSSRDSHNEINGTGRVAALIIHELYDSDPKVLRTGEEDVGQDYEYHVHCPTIDEIDAKHRLERLCDRRGLPIRITAWSFGVQLPHVDRDPTDSDDGGEIAAEVDALAKAAPPTFDPKERAAEKQRSRDEDARALASGEATVADIRKKNAAFRVHKVDILGSKR